MAGLPVTIRLLDPPLHEFLPQDRGRDSRRWRRPPAVDRRDARSRADALHEANPMLGHRGCRLGITYPEIYEMQARAIFEAAVAVEQETGETVEPEIMIPLVATRRELDILKAIDRPRRRRGHATRRGVDARLSGRHDDRAAARGAAAPARSPRRAEFFSFGTNDLTQTDVRPVARRRRRASSAPIERRGILDARSRSSASIPRASASWCSIAAERGRAARPGPQARHLRRAWRRSRPRSASAHEVGLDYVSCSPYRVPIARLAAAQAALAEAERDVQRGRRTGLRMKAN